MNNSIEIIDSQPINATFEDFKCFNFSKTIAPANSYNNILTIIQALANDILYTRKDKEVSIEFYFSKDSFDITISNSYPFFHKSTTFNFKYFYEELEKNINTILSNTLDNLIKKSSVLHKETDIASSYCFFKNLQILELILETDNSLLYHLKNKPFNSGLGRTKDKFKFFELMKYMNISLEINLSCPLFLIRVSSEAFYFSFKKNSIDFKEPDLDIENIIEYQKIIISIFNLNNNFKVNSIKELMAISEILVI